MDNKDMPAMPTGLIHEDVFNSDGEFCGTVEARYVGLSKREHFAGLMMQAEKIHHGASGAYGFSEKVAAKSAVECADALLAELDKAN
jgi:hypothetical protein